MSDSPLTPKQQLLATAIEIAVAAPRRQGSYTYSAGVPWHLIHKLRQQLAALGVDWQEMMPKQEKKSYAKHVPTDQHQYDSPDEPLLCSCGMPLRFYIGSHGGKRGWACSQLSGPTKAFADIPPPEGK